MAIAAIIDRGPRALALAAAILTWAVAPAFAQDAEVIYLEGEPELRSSQGTTQWLDFGSLLRSGDSVVTGTNDYVELEQGAASTIRVDPDTVFTIREIEQGGERQTVMSNSVGSVRYRFNRIAGRNEPQIGTSSVVAGIRGTEVTVYAGADGSSLFLVESGLVEVSSAGETVELAEAQGVEVAAGQPPGAVFEWLGREIDFREWNQERSEAYLRDPAPVVDGLGSQLEVFISGVSEFRNLYDQAAADYQERFDQFMEMPEGDEKEALRDELQLEGANTSTLALNYRYYALSGLSMRRYVLGRMYMELKTRYILDRGNPLYQEFLGEYEAFLERYESGITPGLVEADI
mgnify:CR=1 FL=1